MNPRTFTALLGVALAAGLYAKDVAPKDFADATGKISEVQAALYLAHLAGEPLSKFTNPGSLVVDQEKLLHEERKGLHDIEQSARQKAPWTVDQVAKAYPPKPGKEADDGKGSWREIPGITSEKQIQKAVLQDGTQTTNTVATLGPFILRRNQGELAKETLKDVKGATVGFTDNLLVDGGGAWNSQGILYWPIKPTSFESTNTLGRSVELQFGPAVDWNLAEVEEGAKKDVQELTFSVPIVARVSPGSSSETSAASAFWFGQARPYFQSDFGFRHKILGAEASVEFVGHPFGLERLYVGGFQNRRPTKVPLQYQLRIVPKVDYSDTQQIGPHSSRTLEDDWFRIGSLLGLDFRYAPSETTSFQCGLSYEFFKAVNGEQPYSELLKSNFTWWFNQNMGLTLEFQRGDTPIALKRIEQITLGLELKY